MGGWVPSGTLKGHVFEDVLFAFQNLVSQKKRIYIYSSGSVQAQKLIFGHSISGDLCPYISGYFDTNIGHKIHSDSYRAIADEISVPSHQILFLTDKVSEAKAASEAGCQTVVLNRPGNPEQPAHDFVTWSTKWIKMAECGDQSSQSIGQRTTDVIEYETFLGWDCGLGQIP